ncbi:MAG: circularly permuted type 2 ATP-grasp protein [Xanthomonadales bacterium]|nr:circularly permuted type 2 ATP-grasp protein [Xanthomonadales bacterium]
MTVEVPVGSDLARLLAAYRPPAGVSDELLDGQGQMRPAWDRLLAQIAQLSPEQLQERMLRGDRYLQDAGVFFRQYDQQVNAERDWPLSHMPVVIDSQEWAGICAGLIERADVLERIAADLYGDQQLVRGGHLPAELIAGNPEWLRPLVGVRPRSGHYLHFIAFDIGRGPRGRWWVLGDRTQAPSGAGFALENRIATKRVYADIYDQSRVRHLSAFFRDFRAALEGLRQDPQSLIGMLTPGPLNDTYFEQAYIARYLGILLLEGEDLAVRDGRLLVRTVAGLQPIEVLWRRLDAAWADPLELKEQSRLGTTGLLGALRAGGVDLLNALGSGVLEARALLAFIPRIAEQLNGTPLTLPNIATWWCGHAPERELVKRQAERMIIGSAWSTRLPFEVDAQTAIGGRWVEPNEADLQQWINQHGAQLVGQEALTLSTTPAFEDGRLVPRPMSLRVFLARTAQGWTVMPGGFARIAHSPDATSIAMQRGGSAADVWIVSRDPAEFDDSRGGAEVTQGLQSIALPTRAADNLYWLGRYIERFEGSARLARAYHLRLAESGREPHPLLPQLEGFVERLGMRMEETVPDAMGQALNSARHCAGQVRDRLSVDAWLALKDLGKTVAQLRPAAQPGEDGARAMGVLLRKISGLSGLIHENMYRYTGWRFLSLGRALERALGAANLLAEFAEPDARHGGLHLALEVADSIMVHRRHYGVAISRESVIDLLALDELNPRSLRSQLDQIHEQVQLLPAAAAIAHAPLRTLTQGLRRSLRAHHAHTLDAGALRGIWLELSQVSSALTSAYLR